MSISSKDDTSRRSTKVAPLAMSRNSSMDKLSNHHPMTERVPEGSKTMSKR